MALIFTTLFTALSKFRPSDELRKLFKYIRLSSISKRFNFNKLTFNALNKLSLYNLFSLTRFSYLSIIKFKTLFLIISKDLSFINFLVY